MHTTPAEKTVGKLKCLRRVGVIKLSGGSHNNGGGLKVKILIVYMRRGGRNDI